MLGISFLIGSLAVTFGGWLGLSGSEVIKSKFMLGFLLAQAIVGYGLMKLNKVALNLMPLFSLLAIKMYFDNSMNNIAIFFGAVFILSTFRIFKLKGEQL